jgi:hypothetical protein
MTTFRPETRRWRPSESVDVSETSEPPRTQFVKETETLRSLVLVEGMVATCKNSVSGLGEIGGLRLICRSKGFDGCGRK